MRAKSVWSQKNVATVNRLVTEGRMCPAGLSAVEAAQADGRWERAYAGSATSTVPGDLAAALAADPAAEAFFAGLDRTSRYAVLCGCRRRARRRPGRGGSPSACRCWPGAAGSTDPPGAASTVI
ncbi:Bacteriocin-protection, YdeI or OmpD-Associated [Modestobacter sp. DSM 44400]|uniref:YdeI/OmpD-associated family protein n=1 Tax=Modestobacter sp. DSM 44400 TaxID=1550230 RepID=UPI000894E9E7|nr:YdeI/OmpD-associated family protein [Modestobacter sp. DSM 44400]SDY32147.1 Bacteriocin-protection, YdeI or OmpD-Associated [Modestobacter sp. DSM 44400]